MVQFQPSAKSCSDFRWYRVYTGYGLVALSGPNSGSWPRACLANAAFPATSVGIAPVMGRPNSVNTSSEEFQSAILSTSVVTEPMAGLIVTGKLKLIS